MSTRVPSPSKSSPDTLFQPPLKLRVVPVTPFAQNCSVLVGTRTGMAAAFDPGGDLDAIDGALGKLGASPEKIFLTHGPIDPCGQAAAYAHRIEAITRKLWPLANDGSLVPGHGPMSSFGAERRDNGFVANSVLNR